MLDLDSLADGVGLSATLQTVARTAGGPGPIVANRRCRFQYCRGRDRAAAGHPPAARGADRDRGRAARLRRRGAARPPTSRVGAAPSSNGSQKRRLPTPSRSRSRAAGARCGSPKPASARPEPTSAATRSSASPRCSTIDAGSPVGGGRIRCSMRSAGAAPKSRRRRHRRASYPRSSEELVEQEVPETSLVEFSSHGAELAVGRSRRRFASASPPSAGIKRRMAGLPDRARAAGSGSCPPGSRSKPLELALRLGLEDHGDPGGRHRLHGRRPAPARRPSAPRARSPAIRTDRRIVGHGSTGATSSSGPSSIPLPTLFSFGLAGALSMRAAGSGAHIATASSTLEVGAQPGGLGLGARAGSPASGRGPWRPPRSASW